MENYIIALIRSHSLPPFPHGWKGKPSAVEEMSFPTKKQLFNGLASNGGKLPNIPCYEREND